MNKQLHLVKVKYSASIQQRSSRNSEEQRKTGWLHREGNKTFYYFHETQSQDQLGTRRDYSLRRKAKHELSRFHHHYRYQQSLKTPAFLTYTEPKWDVPQSPPGYAPNKKGANAVPVPPQPKLLLCCATLEAEPQWLCPALEESSHFTLPFQRLCQLWTHLPSDPPSLSWAAATPCPLRTSCHKVTQSSPFQFLLAPVLLCLSRCDALPPREYIHWPRKVVTPSSTWVKVAPPFLNGCLVHLENLQPLVHELR